MITLILIFFPLLAALITLSLKGTDSRKVAILTSLIQLGFTIYAMVAFTRDASVQFLYHAEWMPSFGIDFKVGMDGISLILVLLTNFLYPLILLSASKYEFGKLNSFYFLALLMQSGLIGVFTSQNAFLFYIFWELALIPVYFIAAFWGGENRIRVTLKFFIYTLAGSLFMLLGIIYLYLQTPDIHTFDIDAFYNLNLSRESQSILFWAFFVAFAIKMPVFPFHTWQPDTYTESPAPATMLLSGIMLKMGVYGMIRWMIPVIPAGVDEWASTAIILSVIGVVYGSCMAWVQKDFKRLIAYSSLAHVGLIAAGCLSLNISGLQGGMIQMLSHGINVVGLFFIVEIIFDRTKTRNLNELGGIAGKAPVFSVLFMIIMLGSIALPLTNGFIGEFLLLNGLYQAGWGYAAFAGLSVILGAVYMLNAYKKISFGETNSKSGVFSDLNTDEKLILFPVIIMILYIGIYPKPLLDISMPAVEKLIEITALK